MLSDLQIRIKCIMFFFMIFIEKRRTERTSIIIFHS